MNKINLKLEGEGINPIFISCVSEEKVANIEEWNKITESKFRNSWCNYNYALVCGINTGITVVDIDFTKDEYGDKYDDCEFVKEFPNFKDQFNTLCVKSCNNGYHLYFKYDVDIKNGSDSHHKIDIRNDNGYIMVPPSQIKGKSYELYKQNKIQEIPIELKEWILKNLKLRSGQPNKTNRKTRINNIYSYKETGYTLKMTSKEFKYILSCLKIDTQKENDFRGDYKLWLNVLKAAKFCGYRSVFDKWSKKTIHNNYDKVLNMRLYNNANCTIHHFYWLLKESKVKNTFTYKNVNSEISDYEEIPKRAKLDDITSNKRYFKKNKSYIVKSDTGTGKTTAFMYYIKQLKHKFISIVSRCKLGIDQNIKFSNHGLDIQYYTDREFRWGDNIIITCESLHHLENYDFSDYVVYFDEFESILKHICLSTTMKYRKRFFIILIKILICCKQFICTDADISTITTNFINNIDDTFQKKSKKINKECILAVNKFKHFQNISVNIYTDESNFYDKLKTEEEFLLCCDSKTETEISQIRINCPEDTIIFNSDTSKEDRKKSLDDYKKAIISPTLLYGSDSLMVRPVYAHYKGHTIGVKEMVQQVARARNPTEINVFFVNDCSKITNYDTIEDLQTDNIAKIKYYGDFMSDNYSFPILGEEDNDECGSDKFFNVFRSLYEHVIYTRDAYNTNKKLHFINLMEQKGCNVYETKQKIQRLKDIKELKELVKQSKILNFKSDDEKIKERVNILKIPDDKIEEYKEFLLDDIAISKHFQLCDFFFKDNIKFDNVSYTTEKMRAKNDFVISKLDSTNFKISIIQRFMKIINMTKDNIFNYTPTEEKVIISKSLNELYNKTFNKRVELSKEPIIKEIYSKIMNFTTSQYPVFQKTKRKMINGERFYYYPKDEKEYNFHHELFKLRSYKKTKPKQIKKNMFKK